MEKELLNVLQAIDESMRDVDPLVTFQLQLRALKNEANSDVNEDVLALLNDIHQTNVTVEDINEVIEKNGYFQNLMVSICELFRPVGATYHCEKDFDEHEYYGSSDKN